MCGNSKVAVNVSTVGDTEADGRWYPKAKLPEGSRWAYNKHGELCVVTYDGVGEVETQLLASKTHRDISAALIEVYAEQAEAYNAHQCQLEGKTSSEKIYDVDVNEPGLEFMYVGDGELELDYELFDEEPEQYEVYHEFALMQLALQSGRATVLEDGKTATLKIAVPIVERDN